METIRRRISSVITTSFPEEGILDGGVVRDDDGTPNPGYWRLRKLCGSEWVSTAPSVVAINYPRVPIVEGKRWWREASGRKEAIDCTLLLCLDGLYGLGCCPIQVTYQLLFRAFMQLVLGWIWKWTAFSFLTNLCSWWGWQCCWICAGGGKIAQGEGIRVNIESWDFILLHSTANIFIHVI